MKTRTGFVSNSSSSSFIAYGVTISQNEFINAVRIWNPSFNEVVTSEWYWGGFSYNVPEELNGFDLAKYISNFDYDNHELHIGVEWDTEGGVDVTVPLLDPKDKQEIDDVIAKYNLGLPESSGGVRYS